MTWERAIWLIGVIATALVQQYAAVAPAQQQAQYAEERWAHWKGKNEEKRKTVAELKAEIAAREAECSSLRGEP